MGTVRTANDDDQERKMKGEELIDQVSTKKRRREERQSDIYFPWFLAKQSCCFSSRYRHLNEA